MLDAGRRAQPDRPVRPQARADEAQRPGVCRSDVESCQPGSEAKKLMASPSGSAATASAAWRCPSCCRTSGRRRRAVPGPLDVQRQQQPPAGHSAASTRARSSPAVPRSVRGSATRWEPRTRTCRPTSCSAIPTATTTAARPCGRTAGCRALFRGTEIQSRGAAVLDLHPSAELPAGIQENDLDLLARLNKERRKLYPSETDLDAADPQLRAGRADADRAPRRSSTWPAKPPATRAALRARRPGHRELRHPLPDGPAAGRVGRALHPGAWRRSSRAASPWDHHEQDQAAAWRRSARRSIARRAALIPT